MDVLAGYFTLLGIKEKFYPKTENFDGTAAAASSSKSTSAAGAIVFVVFLIIIAIICGIFAAKLSWSSNTVAEWGNGSKTFFAIIAFFYGISYLFAHLIHKVDLLAKIKQLTSGESRTRLNMPMPPMPPPNRMMQRPRMDDSYSD